ncbi:PAS domain S-box protein [Sphingosinicellaceae bacterium]|nr:PAS domain S-box protein [Sphingosinicellaceae bacterium]
MQVPWDPDSSEETSRRAALSRYDILDTSSEPEFDDIVFLAAQICGAPTALISLIDGRRQWFKAAVGIEARETPRDVAFCAHAIAQTQMMVVEDARLDERFADNPLVTGEPHVRFYAGAQLRTPEGVALGTLCVLDTRTRSLSEDQQSALKVLARQVMDRLETRRLLAQTRIDASRLRLIIEAAVDYAIITTDLDGIIESWSAGAARMFGRDADIVIGRPCAMLFTDSDQAAGVPEAEIRNTLACERAHDERWHPRSNGELFWGRCEIITLRSPGSQPLGLLKILQDRTAPRAAERKLRESETRGRLALDAAELGAFEAVPGSGEVFGDERAHELLGHADTEAVSFDELMARLHVEDRERFDAAVRAAIAAGNEGRLDIDYRVLVAATAEIRWLRSRARVIKLPGERLRLVGTVRDISRERAADEHRRLLSNELQHRVKNTLGVVQGIVAQSLRTVATPAEAREAISSRLTTLAHAHDLLTQTSWQSARIHAVVQGAVLVHLAEPDRVVVEGPNIELKARSALALSMALHELFTNAVKHGALSNADGSVELRWAVGDGNGNGSKSFDIVWQEEGGPQVSPPTRSGFGTRLIGASLNGDLGGRGVVEYLEAGVRWSLATTVEALQEGELQSPSPAGSSG